MARRMAQKEALKQQVVQQRTRKKRRRHVQKRHPFKIAALLCVLITLLLIPFVTPYSVQVVQHQLEIPGLPQDLNGLCIVYLTDLHTGTGLSDARVKSLVAKANAFNPDLLFFGGDYAADAAGAVAFFKQFPGFRAKLMMAGVFGETDRTDEKGIMGEQHNAMIAANVYPLRNNLHSLKLGESRLTVVGLDMEANAPEDIAFLSTQVSAEDFVILLSHTPAVIPDALQAFDRAGENRWFDLALCGQTHGGQINLFGQSIYPDFQKVPDRYKSGWIQENRIPMLISNGVGTSYLPARLFAPAQMHVIVLKRV